MSAPYSVDLKGAIKHVGLGRDKILGAIHAGDLRAHKSSAVDDPDSPRHREPTGKFVIKVADLEAWVDGLPVA